MDIWASKRCNASLNSLDGLAYMASMFSDSTMSGKDKLSNMSLSWRLTS